MGGPWRWSIKTGQRREGRLTGRVSKVFWILHSSRHHRSCECISLLHRVRPQSFCELEWFTNFCCFWPHCYKLCYFLIKNCNRQFNQSSFTSSGWTTLTLHSSSFIILSWQCRFYPFPSLFLSSKNSFFYILWETWHYRLILGSFRFSVGACNCHDRSAVFFFFCFVFFML